jgi:hypothetical protein
MLFSLIDFAVQHSGAGAEQNAFTRNGLIANCSFSLYRPVCREVLKKIIRIHPVSRFPENRLMQCSSQTPMEGYGQGY